MFQLCRYTMPPMPHFGRLPFTSLPVELTYSVIVVVACLMIYLETRDMYELSGHKGVQFFRYAFLFFGLSYLVRFFSFLVRRGGPLMIGDYRVHVMGISIFFGTMAVLSLLYSVLYKRLDERFPSPMLLIMLVSLLISLVHVCSHVKPLMLLVHGAIFVVAVAISSYDYLPLKGKGRRSHFFFIYLLLFLSWFINALAFNVMIISYVSGILLYVVSALMMVLILISIIRRNL